MKKFLKAVPFILFLSCHNTKAMFTNPIEQYGRQEQLTDSVLRSLQQNNEVVIAFTMANYAWVKKIDYRILAMNNNKWKAYTYSNNITQHISSGLNEVEISNDAAEAIWHFIKEKDALKIPGDNGENFCAGDKKGNCNINDGASWQLFFITKDKIANPSYYEPEFYENCCPGNAERKLFIEVANKIRSAVAGGSGNPDR
jgi:hypothetical protein